MKKIIICLVAILPLLVSCEKQQSIDENFLIGKWQWVGERISWYQDDELIISRYEDRSIGDHYYEFFADGTLEEHFHGWSYEDGWVWSVYHKPYTLGKNGKKLIIQEERRNDYGVYEPCDVVYDIRRTDNNSFELIQTEEDSGFIGPNDEDMLEEIIKSYKRIAAIPNK